MSTDTKLQDKIAALLRKAERTDNQKEAEAFAAKAEELILKWGIDRAMLQDKEGRREEIVQRKMTFPGAKGQTRKDWLYLCFYVGLGLGGLEMVTTAHQDEETGRYTDKMKDMIIVGHETDVDAAMWLMSSILLQAQTAVARFWRNQMDSVYMFGAPPASVRSKAKSSFMSGYGTTVRNRLIKLRTRMEAEAGTGTELVLFDRSAAVKKAFGEMFPNVTSGRGRRGTTDSNAYHNGADAGHSADLGQKRFSGGATGAIRS